MRADRRLILGGIAVLLALVLAWQLLGRGGGPEPAPVTPPPPAPVAAAPSEPPQSPAAPAASPEGLRLFGVTGSGAIIGTADGRQRLVRLQSDVLPGLKLERVGVDHAVLRSAASEFRLDFTGVSAAGEASAVATATSGPSGEAAIRADVLRYQLAFEPRRAANGRINSHILRPGQNLPALERAGLRPGDVVLRVNDSEFDSERVMDLAWTIANADRVNFDIERNGQPMRLSAPGGRSQ